MGEKDMSEKILEDYNDVFSDIVNVLLFHGQELIEPSALESISVHSRIRERMLSCMNRSVMLQKSGKGTMCSLLS